MSTQNSPFDAFTDRINKDLFAWTLRKQQYESLLKDYQNTLQFVKVEYNTSANVLVDISGGQGILCEGKRVDGSIAIRMNQQFKQAQPVLRSLINLYKEKIDSAKVQIRKINGSMREVEELIQQYSSLA